MAVRHLVVEAVTGERRVVRLDVQPVLALEPVADEEAVDRRDVVVVLVLGGLHRLRFDEQLAPEADPRLVLGDEVEEARQLVALAAEVRVQERVVALAAAPQDVVLATEPLCHLEHVLDLGRGEREHLGVGVRGRAGLVARMGEQVGGAPQEPDAGPLLVPGGVVGERIEVRTELRVRRALWRHVAVMEAVVGDADLGEELEGDRHLRSRRRHLVAAAVEPGTVHGPDPEHVHAGPGERVPETDTRPEVVLHALARARDGRARRP